MSDILICKNDNDIYTLETNGFRCVGYYKKTTKSTCEVNLLKWYDKTTKRYKTNKNKLYNHTMRWFAYMIEKYYVN